MNKVFKVIWSKTKNCYVVASELAKTHTKAPKSSIISRTLVAGVLACVIGAGIVAPVYADGTNDNTFTISVPKASGAEDVYHFNLADDLGVTVDNTVTSYDGIQTFASASNNLQSVIDGNMSRLSTIYQGDGQRGLYDGDAGVFKRDGNFLLYEATHEGERNNGLVIRYPDGTGRYGFPIDYSDLSGINLTQALETLYNRRYDSPQGAASVLEQQFGANNVLSNLLRFEYTENGGNYARNILNNGAGSVPNTVYGNAIRGGTSGLYADLKELVDVLTYDEHKSDLSLNVNNLDVNNAQGNTIVGTGTVSGTNSISVGAGHQITGNNSGAFGDPTIINGDNSYSIGNNNTIAENTSDVFILGNNVNATASDVVALGSGSLANQEHTVSVGNATTKRRLVNVADGVSNSDVVTVGQLRDAISATGGIHGVGIANISENATNYNGEGAIGYDSVAIGDAKAAGAGSVAVGSRALTTGTNSVAIGTNATATGDGTTREEIESILANNKAIRDTLNDARADYTASKADYDRQREIWEGQNEAYARVQAANQTIAGYQNEINSTLQPNADSANNAYNTAKADYDALKADLENRLAAIKYLDFSLYGNTQGGQFNLSAAASDLKTQTESGTSFNLPQTFYESYITNYIKAEGDLRENKIIAENGSYHRVVGSQHVGDWNTGSDIGTNTISFYPNSWDNSKDYTELIKAVGIDDAANKSTYDSISDTHAVYVKETDKVLIENAGLNVSDYEGINPSYANISFDSTSAGGGWNSIYNNLRYSLISGDITQGRETLGQNDVYKYVSTQVLNDTDYADKITELNNEKNYLENQIDTFKSNWDNTLYIQNSSEASSLMNEQVNHLKEVLNNRADVIKKVYDISHEQYLYEQYRDAGNETDALIHLGLKENARKDLIRNFFNNDEDAYNTWANSGLFTSSVSEGYVALQSVAASGENSGYFTFTKYLTDDIATWLKENIVDCEDATEVALRTLNENLDAEMAQKQQALANATNAKNAADEALANKQQQIADTTPSQQDLDDAAAAEASAQDLAQKEAKLNADEEALEQAKANLQNLETIATDGESAIAIGGNAVTTAKNGIGIGTDALVTGEEAIGIGKNAIASGKNSIAIGTDNSVSRDNSIAIGTNNGITGLNSIAIGNNNVISGQNSVAIGNNLSVTEDNVVLIGTRRVTGVADGTSATDAATVGQTFELVAGSGMTVVEDGVNAIGQKKYKLNSTATGGSTYVSGDNISIVDDVVSAVGLIKYDGDDKSSASLEGTRGTKLTNLKQAALTRTSTDAVIGAQLFATNANVAGMQTDITTNANNISSLTSGLTSVNSAVAANSVTIDTLDDLKADKNLTNLTDVGRQVISAAAANAVQEYMAANGGNGGALGNNNTNLLGGTNTLSTPKAMGFGLMANPLGSGNDDIVTNNDLLGDGNDISMEVQAALDGKVNLDLDNLSDTGISAIRNAVADDLALKADKDSVYTKEETDSFLNAKANQEDLEALDVRVTSNEGSIAALDNRVSNAESAVDQIVTVDLPEIRNTLDLKADKDSVYSKEETDAKLLDKADKSSVYNKTEVDSKLSAKVNVDASNIDVDAWSKKLATGEVLPGNTGLVDGGTVFNSVMAVAQSNPVQANENILFIGKQAQYDNVNTIDVSNSKGEARVMTGVITNPEDATSVANVGYVNAVGQNIMGNINGRFSEMDNKISDVGANAAAMSALMPVGDDADKKWSLSAAVGHYDSSTASAVGLFYKPSDNVIVNVRGTVGSDENMLAGGVSVALDKGSTPGVSKAQLVRTVNAQAEQIQNQNQEIQQMKMNHEAEMNEMRQQIVALAKKVNEQKK